MRSALLAIILLTASLSHSRAQSISGFDAKTNEDDPFEHKSYFMYGINYLSNNVYLGRKDSAVVPYISPYIGYHDKSGFYAKGLLSYSPGKANGRFDVATLEAGYDHSFGNFNAGVNADKFFYNKNSKSIRANTKGGIGVDGQYNNDLIEPQATFDVNFNKSSTDYVAGFLLDHNFEFLEKRFQITPIIAMNAGTQNYYDEYFKARIAKADKKAKVKKAIDKAGDFNVLDYEISIKTTLSVNKWLFTLIPAYAIPVNAASITLPNKVVTESLSNSFYCEVDICHR